MDIIFMTDLINFNNLYLDLSQSAYEGRPHSFSGRVKGDSLTENVNYSISAATRTSAP